MFFIMSITTGRKDIPFHQTMICSCCGKYGHFSVYMTYTVLSLFFIPCFKWNRKYYVTTSCCNTTYQLDPEIGKGIARGEYIEIRQEDLSLVSNPGWYHTSEDHKTLTMVKRCANCGFTTEEDYDYCPKCGKPL